MHVAHNPKQSNVKPRLGLNAGADDQGTWRATVEIKLAGEEVCKKSEVRPEPHLSHDQIGVAAARHR